MCQACEHVETRTDVNRNFPLEINTVQSLRLAKIVKLLLNVQPYM